MNKTEGKIIIPSGIVPWPHEMRVARILSNAGHEVEFIPKGHTKTADILLNGVEFEIKSPLTNKANSLEHILKKALKQSPNIIIDSSRMDGRKLKDKQILTFLINKVRRHREIRRLLFITKRGQIIDVKRLL